MTRKAAIAAAFALLGCIAHAQQESPLQGQGWPPNEGTTVFVSAVLDRMLSIDDSTYRFEAVLYLFLSWKDERAAETAYNASVAAAQSGSCNRPCINADVWEPGAPCCDGMFLPGFALTNVRGLSQDRVVRYGIHMSETFPGAVAWWNRIQGEFYTPLSFRAFPFDRQYLIVQAEMNNYGPSMKVERSFTGTTMYQPRSGDMVSGWTVESLDVMPFNYSFVDTMLREGGTSHPEDPFPLNSVDPTAPDFSAGAPTTGFNIVIVVNRVSTYYIITAIIPIAINVYLALLVFAIHPKHLDTRLGIVVTLFLALTAILYVINGYLPASSSAVPTQQLVIVSYFVLAGVGIFSIMSYSMVTFQRHRIAAKRRVQARRQFSQRWEGLKRTRTLSRSLSLRQRGRSSGGGPGLDSLPEGGLGASVEEGDAAAARFAEAGGVGGLAALQEVGKSPKEEGVGGQLGGGTGGGSGGPDSGGSDSEGSGDSAHSSVRVAAVQHHRAEGGPGVLSMGSAWHSMEESGAGAGGLAASSGLPMASQFANSHPQLQRRSHESANGGGTGAVGGSGSGGQEQSKGWALLRWASCCMEPRRGRRRARGPQIEDGGWREWRLVLWIDLQRWRMAEMASEMERNPDYALHVATSLDRFMLYSTIAGYTLAIILIFAIQAQYQPSVEFG